MTKQMELRVREAKIQTSLAGYSHCLTTVFGIFIENNYMEGSGSATIK